MNDPIYFRFGDWSALNPTHETLLTALWTARYSLATLTQSQAVTICEAAEAYQHYAAHPAGTESVVAQLRILRRGIRDAAQEPKR